MQQAYERFGNGAGSLPVTERLTRRVLSLPIYPELSLEMVDRVAEAVSELAR
jgi:dTDP-4-amino-4,6-dideoxygalactose transaminase